MRVVLTLAAMVVLCEYVTAWFDYSVHFGDCFSVNDATEDHSYQLSWSGYDHFSGCKVSFHGYDSDNPFDQYKICVKATNWNIVDSGVTLKYYSGSLATYLEKTYSRSYGDPTYKWCADEDDYVDIMLTTSSSSSFQGQITLEVTAIKTYSYYNYGGTIGGAVGGVIVLVAVCVIIGIACRRRSYVRTTTYTAPTPASTIITQSGSQQMGGYSNPGYPSSPVAPPAYYPPSNAGYNAPQQGYQNSPQYSTTGQQPPP